MIICDQLITAGNELSRVHFHVQNNALCINVKCHGIIWHHNQNYRSLYRLWLVYSIVCSQHAQKYSLLFSNYCSIAILILPKIMEPSNFVSSHLRQILTDLKKIFHLHIPQKIFHKVIAKTPTNITLCVGERILKTRQYLTKSQSSETWWLYGPPCTREAQ